ncbi:MAG: poly-gamma-glutamate biosynthesis protein PgsC [Firmicutes bacterium ZCTH02-B6]|nr:MAG: poly-gamma-glutamate biosynthesis protein PgsC [Firmicutes bacterium ZCTH02-B6]
MIEFAVGLGIALNLLSLELLGLSAGGMVVPGYLALFLDRPGRLAATLAAAAVTLGAVRFLSRWVILYGRRKYAAMILVGFLANLVVDEALMRVGPWLGPAGAELRVIGYIVPGLLANEMHDQGIVSTAAIALICAVIVRAAATVLIRFGVLGGV